MNELYKEEPRVELLILCVYITRAEVRFSHTCRTQNNRALEPAKYQA